jgi:predicted flap endonuclease-1-like 5' DNA nuclease
MNFENLNIWCWLIPSLVGVISGILGYLIGKSSSTTIDNTGELNTWKDKNSKLQADLDACNGKLKVAATAAVAGAVTTAASLTAKTVTPEAKNPFDAAAAKAAFGKTVKENDLKVVEGIGPKISEMFNNSGITTWKALSETTVARCQEVLNGGGDRYKVHNPASWPMQSKMASEGKWAELSKWQDEHDHGKL